jgi:hypothetical protein
MIEERIFDKSECAIHPREKAYFKEIMTNKKFITVLKYKCSTDGCSKYDFHRMCDDKGPTVSLFKIKNNNQCIGGFTSA